MILDSILKNGWHGELFFLFFSTWLQCLPAVPPETLWSLFVLVETRLLWVWYFCRWRCSRTHHIIFEVHIPLKSTFALVGWKKIIFLHFNQMLFIFIFQWEPERPLTSPRMHLRQPHWWLLSEHWVYLWGNCVFLFSFSYHWCYHNWSHMCLVRYRYSSASQHRSLVISSNINIVSGEKN